MSRAGQATWTGDVNSSKWTRFVIQTTLPWCNHSRSLWASHSWHVC